MYERTVRETKEEMKLTASQHVKNLRQKHKGRRPRVFAHRRTSKALAPRCEIFLAACSSVYHNVYLYLYMHLTVFTHFFSSLFSRPPRLSFSLDPVEHGFAVPFLFSNSKDSSYLPLELKSHGEKFKSQFFGPGKESIVFSPFDRLFQRIRFNRNSLITNRVYYWILFLYSIIIATEKKS